MMRAKRAWLFLAVAAAVLSLAAVSPGQAEGRRVDPRADRTLQRMSEFLASAGAFRVRAQSLVDDVQVDGQKIQRVVSHDIAVRRPDRFMARRSGHGGRIDVCFDGRTFTAHHVDRGLYASTDDAGRTIDEVIDFVFDEYGISVPVADVMSADPYELLSEYVLEAKVVGTVALDGVQTTHIACRQEFIDWQVWVEDGARPVPRRLVITYKDQPDSPQYTVRLTDWEFGAHLPPSVFELTLPGEARRIEFSAAAAAAAAQTGGAE